MKYSFIVPVYNTSKYLDHCLESLLSQKGADYEILLVDDGSTDNSGEMCDAYAEKHPDIVRVIHKDNEGLLLTRRKGFKEAKGDWFINVDSDDYISKDLLITIVKAVDKYQPDMVMYNFAYFNDTGDVSQSRLSISNESVFEGDGKQHIYEKRLLSNDINNMWSKALKREIVDFDADYSTCGIRNMCEDAIQVLPLFTNAKKIVYLNTPLYYYRKGQESITASRSYDSWMSSKICFLLTEEYLEIWNVPFATKQKYYTRYLGMLASFLRWLFDQPEGILPMSKTIILQRINNSFAFQRCLKMFHTKYLSSFYLKLSVPFIMRYVKKENEKGLRRFFMFESNILTVSLL